MVVATGAAVVVVVGVMATTAAAIVTGDAGASTGRHRYWRWYAGRRHRLQWRTGVCCNGERESIAAEDRVVLQWQTRVLERETEWRCNGRRECCSGRPSRVAVVDKSAAAGDRVALQWQTRALHHETLGTLECVAMGAERWGTRGIATGKSCTALQTGVLQWELKHCNRRR